VNSETNTSRVVAVNQILRGRDSERCERSENEILNHVLANKIGSGCGERRGGVKRRHARDNRVA
jgi:hypothetical protein